MTLTTSYFPNLLYLETIKKSERIEIEACENFQKQSFRNRFAIASDKGIQILSMPVHSHNNMPIKEVMVDYTMPWQREHLRAVETCYGSAPYFPYAIDKIEHLFSIREKWLLDYNMVILDQILKIFQIRREIKYTETFIPITEDDPRLITSRNHKNSSQKEYYQVFSDKQPFIPNLSIIDYMMCEGFNLG